MERGFNGQYNSRSVFFVIEFLTRILEWIFPNWFWLCCGNFWHSQWNCLPLSNSLPIRACPFGQTSIHFSKQVSKFPSFRGRITKSFVIQLTKDFCPSSEIQVSYPVPHLHVPPLICKDSDANIIKIQNENEYALKEQCSLFLFCFALHSPEYQNYKAEHRS